MAFMVRFDVTPATRTRTYGGKPAVKWEQMFGDELRAHKGQQACVVTVEPADQIVLKKRAQKAASTAQSIRKRLAAQCPNEQWTVRSLPLTDPATDASASYGVFVTFDGPRSNGANASAAAIVEANEAAIARIA